MEVRDSAGEPINFKSDLSYIFAVSIHDNAYKYTSSLCNFSIL